MYPRLLPLLTLILALVAGASPTTAADALVTIDDQAYTADDVRTWWHHYREPDMAFPATAQPFIDWQLTAREAQRLGLEQEPTFKRKVEVFLRARAMMQLRAEEVDAHIAIDDDTIRTIYRRDYLPLWQVTILSFADEKHANTARAALAGGEDFDAWLGRQHHAASRAPGLTGIQRRLLRPVAMAEKPIWRRHVTALQRGAFSPVFADGNGFVFFRLEERHDEPGDEDYQRVAESIRRQLYRQAEDRLTRRLVERLLPKYGIEVDRELLARLTPETTDPEILAQPLVTTGTGAYPAGIIVDKLKREVQLRRRQPLDEAQRTDLKERLVAGMVADIVLLREALARHYEERPVLAPAYRFYRQHRLRVELFNRLLPEAGAIPVTDDEINAYYEEHRDAFSHPATSRFLQFTTTDEDLARQVWLRTLAGTDLATAAREVAASEAAVRSATLDSLEPEIRRQLTGLNLGETSRPFRLGDQTVLVSLQEHRQAATMPLAEVRQRVVADLQQEKREAERQRILERLRQAARIQVDDEGWQRLRAELASQAVRPATNDAGPDSR